MLSRGSDWVPCHSALMAHPKVGTFCFTSSLAPVNSSTDTGSTANTLSWVRSWFTWAWLLDSWSSSL